MLVLPQLIPQYATPKVPLYKRLAAEAKTVVSKRLIMKAPISDLDREEKTGLAVANCLPTKKTYSMHTHKTVNGLIF